MCFVVIAWYIEVDVYGVIWIGFIGLRIDTVAGCCERFNERFISIRDKQFLISWYLLLVFFKELSLGIACHICFLITLLLLLLHSNHKSVTDKVSGLYVQGYIQNILD
jgi:hypothetical protein